MTATPRLARARPHWQSVLRVAGLVAFLLVVVTHLPSLVAWSRGCKDVATGLRFPVNAVDHPYGTVRSCQVLDSRTDLFRDAHNNVVLLLDTDAGSVAVRVDYRDISLGRQYRAPSACSPSPS